MTENIEFPLIDDFYSEGEDITDSVQSLSQCISQLLKIPVDQYDERTEEYLKSDLPSIWKIVLDSPHPSRGLLREISIFTEQYCLLCVYTDLIPSMILAISTAFDSSFLKGSFYKKEANLKIMDLSNLKGSNTEVRLPSNQRPQANSKINPLISQIVLSGMFQKTEELFDDKKLTIEQISAIVQLFTCIESSIVHELVFAILPILFCITHSLIKNSLSSEIRPANIEVVCKFWSNFSQMISDSQTIESILSVLVDLSSEERPVKIRHTAILVMIHIIETAQTPNSANMIKPAMINAIATSSQSSMMNSVCNFLPRLAKVTEFTDDDLHEILLKARNDEKLVSALVDVIKTVNRKIDKFASELTSYNILSPSLYCLVIGKTDDKEITRNLFHQLLAITDRLMETKRSIDHVEINERVKFHIDELSQNGDDLIKLLSFLFLCAPDTKTVCNLLTRIFELPELPDDLVKMLNNFTRKLNDFDSVPVIQVLFNETIRRLKKIESDYHNNSINEEEQKIGDSLVQVVTQWIKMSNHVKTATPEILKQLSELDFSIINDYIPCLANEVISKCSADKSNVDFLFKALNDTVPPQRAQWLINSLFNLIHNNKDLVSNCFDVIIGHLQSPVENDNHRYINGVYLLYNAVTYEADFFMIGEQNIGFTQKVILHLPDDNITEMLISLHPFHSTRRIYAEVANALNIETDQFQLMLTDEDDNEKHLKFNVPLETISTIGFLKEEKKNSNEISNENSNQTLYKEIPIELKYQKNEDYKPNPKVYLTPFLDLLAPKISILFDLIDKNDIRYNNNVFEYDFESQILFLILKLFPTLNIAPKNPIQEVLTNSITLENAAIFKDSIRIFPFAISSSINNFINEKQEATDDHKNIVKSFIIELASHGYDIVSCSLASRALNNLQFQLEFDKENMKKCLLDCNSQQIRTITSKFISTSLVSVDSFVELIEFTLLKKNRSKTKPFFDCIARLNIEKEIFVPFYQKLEQYEYSFYANIDQTFISLLSLIPQNEEMVTLTIKRLFSPPTCRNEIVPFVHTTESWNAALKFIQTSISIPRLHSLLSTLTGDIVQTELSSDYTFKGRIGIVNLGSTCYMNALLQVLNSFQHVSYNIISKTKEKAKNMTDFILELRNCLAKLRYLRGTVLSLSKLTKTIDPKFNPTIQQDVCEFFDSIVNKISDELKDEDDITNLLKIEISRYIKVEDGTLPPKEDSSFFLSIPTENVSNLSEGFDLYFKDEPINDYEYKGKKVQANLFHSIKKWPDYLVIQLRRWEYHLETERHKLVHEFDFPVELKGDDIKSDLPNDIDYTLSGVVIHQGNADQGHYFAIVKGDDNEWYFCNDKKIEYFDINSLAQFSYGESDESQNQEDIFTGYLLFYKKVGIKNLDTANSFILPPDLEEEINAENAKNWPSTIFYSKEFVDYTQRMLLENSNNSQMLDIAFTVLFRISICDENLLRNWCNTIKDKVFKGTENKIVYERFFDYIENDIGTALTQLFAISDNVTNDLSSLINDALLKVPDSTKPLRSILKCVPDNQFLKRMFCVFLFDTISNVKRNNIDWSNEDETLTMMLNILSIQLSKEVQRQITKQHITAMNNVLGLFFDLYRFKGCCESVMSVFDIQRMNKVNYIYKKCENFNRLLFAVSSIQDDFLYDTQGATPATLELFQQLLPQQSNYEIDSSEQITLDLYFLFPTLESLIFCDNKLVREDSCGSLMEMIGSKNNELAIYLKESLVKDQLPPLIKEEMKENTVALFIVGQFPKLSELISSGNDEICLEFIDVVLRTCYVSPVSLLSEFSQIVSMFLTSQNLVVKRKLLKLIHHIIAYDKSIINDSTYSDLIDEIMKSNVTSSYAIQLLWAFKEKADHSVLSGACVKYYLTSEVDENIEILIDLLRKGLHPDEAEIPNLASNFIQLKIANELWNVWPDKQNALANFMLSAFDFAKPFKLFFENSGTLKKTIELLNDFCPDELKKKMDEVKNDSN